MTDSQVVITFSDGSQITETMRYFGEDEFNTIIQWYIDNGAAIVLVNGQTFTPASIEPTPEPTPEQPSTQEPQPTEIVSISVGAFQVINNRIGGEILFIAEPSFDFGATEQVIANVRFKLPDTPVGSFTKVNTLNFTTSQRDERIFYNENALGPEMTAEISVFRLTLPVATQLAGKTITFGAPTPIVPPDFLPPTLPPKPSIAGNVFAKVAVGLFMGGVAIAAIGSRRKK